METLLVGNSVILLFWVYITFIIDVEKKYKVVVLMYLITYVTNVLRIVPTVYSYILMIAALFLELEFLDDKFKKQIIKGAFEKVVDFSYLMIAQYAIIPFTCSLLLSSDYVLALFENKVRVGLYLISFVLFYCGCKGASNEAYVVCTFDEIKKKIDGVKKYRDFLAMETTICNENAVLFVEDGNYFERGERYTFFNAFYLSKAYRRKILRRLRRFWVNTDKTGAIKRAIRGYSTIEMQLLRTLAIKEGYNHVIRRKVYEILYSRLFWKNLRKYYEYCECEVFLYKDYLLYLYLRKAACLNKGGEKHLEQVINKPREQICDYTKEELFVMTLCFSGKVKRSNILDIYFDVIYELGLDEENVRYLVSQLNA